MKTCKETETIFTFFSYISLVISYIQISYFDPYNVLFLVNYLRLINQFRNKAYMFYSHCATM